MQRDFGSFLARPTDFHQRSDRRAKIIRVLMWHSGNPQWYNLYNPSIVRADSKRELILSGEGGWSTN